MPCRKPLCCAPLLALLVACSGAPEGADDESAGGGGGVSSASGPDAGSGAGPSGSSGASGGEDPSVTPACAPERCEGEACDALEPTSEIVAMDVPRLGAPDVATPPPPIVRRRLRLGKKGAYTGPSIPPFRTTTDARVALVGGSFAALRAEMLKGAPLALADAQVGGKLLGARVNVPGSLVHGSLPNGKESSAFVCQPNRNQPSACGPGKADDCYDLVLVQEVQLPDPTPSDGQNDARVVLEGIPVRVRAAKPKTLAAEVVDVEVAPQSEWALSGKMPFALMAELVATADGRLLVGRLLEGDDDEESLGAGVTVKYRLGGGGEHTANFSLFYAYASEPCDVKAWAARDGATFTSLRPLTAAPFDPRLKSASGEALYGIAARPMRDAFGKELGEKDVLAGSYPWVDREGNNVFFSTINPVPLSKDLKAARFPIARVDEGEGKELLKVGSSPRGFAVVGSWTQGKTVMLDGLLNNEDYGFRADRTHALGLYRASSGPMAVLVNGGGKLGVPELGLKDARANNHHLESVENQLAMHVRGLPVTPRDVVWNVTRGLAMDEVVFDDFLDPHVVLFAEMNAAWRQRPDNPRNGSYLDGFSFDAQKFVHDPSKVRLQNAAASPVYPLAEPGRLEGDARVEPVALGGVRGRGLFLGPGARARFDLPASLGPAAGDAGFYVGVFVDARDELEGPRHLLTLELGGKSLAVTLEDGAVLRARDPASGESVAFDVSCLAGSWVRAFHHVGLLFQRDGAVVALLDGNPVGSASLPEPLRLGGGALVLGGPSGEVPGLRGWYDEARLVVEGEGQLTGPGSVELLCNYARGTSLAVGPGSPLRPRSELASFARERAASLGAYAPPGDDLLFCGTDYRTDYAIGRGAIPKGTRWVRDEVLLEGTEPLAYDAPRPDSRSRGFCLSCHVSRDADPLRPSALALGVLEAGDKPAMDDLRTQPMQPPSPGAAGAVARGHIPAGWVEAPNGKTFPASPMTGPQPILRWLLR